MSIEKTSTAGWTPEQWQAWRKKVQTIGGSDAAVVLGLNPYKSPYALWCEKTGAVEPEDLSDKEAVRLGNDLEEYVARRWCEATEKKVRRERAILHNPAYPFAHANIDRAVVGEPDAGLECKTTSNPEIIQKVRAGEIPDSWYCQCMHYMMVTGAHRWYLAVLAFGRGFYSFTIARDDTEVNALARAEQAFYHLVLSRQAPAVDGTGSTMSAISRLLSHSDGRTIDASGARQDLMRYATLRKSIGQLEDQLKECEANIKIFMGDAEKAVTTGYSVTWKSQDRSTFNREKWEAEHGKIPDMYFRKSTSRPFKVTVKES